MLRVYSVCCTGGPAAHEGLQVVWHSQGQRGRLHSDILQSVCTCQCLPRICLSLLTTVHRFAAAFHCSSLSTCQQLSLLLIRRTPSCHCVPFCAPRDRPAAGHVLLCTATSAIHAMTWPCACGWKVGWLWGATALMSCTIATLIPQEQLVALPGQCRTKCHTLGYSGTGVVHQVVLCHCRDG